MSHICMAWHRVLLAAPDSLACASLRVQSRNYLISVHAVDFAELPCYNRIVTYALIRP